jgi:hypothetical protein
MTVRDDKEDSESRRRTARCMDLWEEVADRISRPDPSPRGAVRVLLLYLFIKIAK